MTFAYTTSRGMTFITEEDIDILRSLRLS